MVTHIRPKKPKSDKSVISKPSMPCPRTPPIKLKGTVSSIAKGNLNEFADQVNIKKIAQFRWPPSSWFLY